jgi:predicted transcriptional regulator of viral defense system
MQTAIRTLGPKEAQLVLSLSEQRRDVVRASEIIEMLGSEGSARNVIQGLVKKGWLVRLVGGRYMFLPPERGPDNLGENNTLALASAAVEPCYVGWWGAASFYGLTTQRPSSLAVAVLRQRPSREIEGTEVRFVMVKPRKFFGFCKFDVYGRPTTISTAAKTVVDCVDRPDLCGGPAELARIVHGGASEVDPAEMVDDALRMESTALLQRLGFLTDLVGWQIGNILRDRIHDGIPRTARSTFGRAERQDGDVGYVGDWGLYVRARQRDLLADVPRLAEKAV